MYIVGAKYTNTVSNNAQCYRPLLQMKFMCQRVCLRSLTRHFYYAVPALTRTPIVWGSACSIFSWFPFRHLIVCSVWFLAVHEEVI